MPTPAELIATIQACPPGMLGWRAFEDAGTEALKYLFVPRYRTQLFNPHVFRNRSTRCSVPNRNMTADTFWGQLNIELKARLVLVEFKNYDLHSLGKDEVDQTRNYLTRRSADLA